MHLLPLKTILDSEEKEIYREIFKCLEYYLESHEQTIRYMSINGYFDEISVQNEEHAAENEQK